MSGVTMRSIMSVSTVKEGTTMKSMNPGDKDIKEQIVTPNIFIVFISVFEFFNADWDKKKPKTMPYTLQGFFFYVQTQLQPDAVNVG